MACANSSHNTLQLNPGLENRQKKITVTTITEYWRKKYSCRDGNAKNYSNKGGRDDNKYNRHPYITNTCSLASHNTALSLACGATVSECVHIYVCIM